MLQLLLEMISTKFLFFALHLSNTGSFPPPLNAEEEQACLLACASGDSGARDKLIEHNLRLVVHVIKKYYANCMEQDDLISVGTIGLIKAIDTFNVGKGARLATYAARCIDNATTAVRLHPAKKLTFGLLFAAKSSLLAAQRRRGGGCLNTPRFDCLNNGQALILSQYKGSAAARSRRPRREVWLAEMMRVNVATMKKWERRQVRMAKRMWERVIVQLTPNA